MTAVQPAVSAPRFGAPECRFCGVPLTPHQAARGGVCDAPACEAQRVQEASRLAFQRSWEEYVERQRLGVEDAAAEVVAGVRQLGQPPEKIAFGVVPHQNHALKPLPAERLASFAGHLVKIIADAFKAGPPPEPDLRQREHEERREEPLIDATCATCQGKCCFLGGGTDAFLTTETIQLYRWRNPDKTPREIREHYLAQVPESSVEYSCVYHGPMGCTLRRHDRADICNRYHCNPQSDLLRRFRAMEATAAVIVGNDDDVGPAVGLFDADGWRKLGPVDDAAAVSPELVGRTVAAAIAQAPPDMPGDTRPARPAEPVCAWCGAHIDRHRAVTRQSCGRPSCERRRVAELTAEFERRKETRHAGLVKRMREAHASEIDGAVEALGVPAAEVAFGVVPAAESRFEDLSAARRAAFAMHLDQMISEGFDEPLDAPEQDASESLVAPEPAVAVAACATCRGSCCRGGGNTGYLSAEDVLRYRRREPAADADGLRALYLGRLPGTVVRGSCVFHGELGCALAREERSAICNGFRCRGLGTLLSELEKEPAPAAVAILAGDEGDGRERRLAIFDNRTGTLSATRAAEQVRPLTELA